MKNIGMSKLQHLLFVLLLFALTGCGASNSNTSGSADNSGGTGLVSAKFVYPAGGADIKTAGKTVAAIPAGVVSIRFRITGPYQIPGDTSSASRYTAVKVSFPAAAGGGTVAVNPGTGLIVIAEALNAGDTVLYEGIISSVNGAPIKVVAGATTDLGTITMKAPVVKQADISCLACHENSRDTNGNSLVANYKLSRHYNITNSPVPKFGVNSTGCAGCHGPGHAEGDGVTKNPDYANPAANGASSRCYECHNAGGNFPALHADRGYLGTNSCTVCHKAHTLAFQQVDDLALNHGNTAAGTPWDAESASTSCTRCHTGAGFALLLAGSPQVAYADGAILPLTCDNCHTSDKGVLNPGAFSVTYNTGYPLTTFPDASESNLCIRCHSGRTDGNDAIRLIVDVTAQASVPSVHYLPAAAVMYLKAGFINFTSLDAVAPGKDSQAGSVAGSLTYGKSLLANSTGVGAVPDGVVGGVTSKHRRLGSADIFGAETWIPASGVFDTGGPCVTCHVQANVAGMPAAALGTNVGGTYDGNGPYYVGAMISKRSDSHKFSATSMNAGQQVCNPCHGDEAALLAPGANGAALKLEEAKPAYDAGIAVAVKLFETNYAIKAVANSSNSSFSFYELPYVVGGTNTAVRDWTRAGKTGALGTLNLVQARKLLGAAYNLKLWVADPGAYVHGRTYTQRLLFDTVDFLDNAIMDKSAATAYTATGAVISNAYLLANPLPANGSWLWKAGGVRP